MLVKKIKTANGHYIYDTWTNEILSVDAAVYDLLPGETSVAPTIDEKTRQEAQAAIAEAQAGGYFSTQSPEISNFPQECHDGIRKTLTETGPDHLIINLTERCNFRCRYCSYSGAYENMRTHSEKRMSPETLHAALDWLVSFPRNEYGVGFYGGEPLMEMDVIEDAVSYLRSRTDKPVTLRTTTNGALLNEKTCRFLIDHDFRVNISIDGPAEVNDRYRLLKHGVGGFAHTWAGIQRLHDMSPEWFSRRVSYSMVAAPPVELMKIQKFTDAHREIFADHSISISSVNPYPSNLGETLPLSGSREAFIAERDALFSTSRTKMLAGLTSPADFSLNFFKNDFLDLHQREMSRMEPITTSDGQCVPGDGKCMVDLDGSLYMCERVGGTRRLGDVYKGFDLAAVFAFLDEYHEFLQEHCRHRWMLRLCNKCFVHFRHDENFSRERLNSYCANQEKRWSWVLERYIGLREEMPEVFDWAPLPD